ncbi:prolipoprotein diacylglyceryl transferase [Pedobacter sp.]
MDFPLQFRFAGQQYHWHFLLETLAFLVGVRLYYFMRKGVDDPISSQNRLWIMLGAMLGALIGSRLFAILEDPAHLSQLNFQVLYASKTIAGGLLGGLFGVELIKKIIGVRIASGDIYVIPILVALIIGRWGCFLMGVAEPTYGKPTDFLLGMDLGDGIKRHPVMLYEILFASFLLVFFILIRSKKLPNGEKFKLFMVLYFLFRFLMEFLKPYQSLFLNLSSIHWSAIIIFIYYYKFLWRLLSGKLFRQTAYEN